MSRQGRIDERQRIREAATSAGELAAKGNCGPAMTDAMFYHQMILMGCNLGETLDARGLRFGLLDEGEGDR